MNKEKQEELMKKHKYMFEKYYFSGKELKEKTGEWWPILNGIQCDDGWFELLDKLMNQLTASDPDKKIHVQQIKEKFGGLRFYFDIEEDKITRRKELFDKFHKIIMVYERNSFKTCEVCGKPGKLRCTEDGHLLKTVCKEHRILNINDGISLTFIPYKKLHKDDKVAKETFKVVDVKFDEEKDTHICTLDDGNIVQQEDLTKIGLF